MQKQWNMQELMDLGERNFTAEEMNPVCAKHDVQGWGVDIDDKTNKPFLKISLVSHGFFKDRREDLSDIPAAMGPDQLPVRVEHRKRAHLI